MKLYTEEQVRMLDINVGDSTIDEIIGCLTPIELPSDDEIEKAFKTHSFGNAISFNSDCGKCFSDGIKWMKEQILKQNVPELRNADGTYGQWGTSGINNQNK